ncbi:histidine phosphatase family protein [Thalassobacillus sp. CUG 92003]|uniref:histidine phosphatase family protein n=1 Tax=Thalassobacillus sp. CUG 92003 TaxID=2736641 RepID=UPI0015E7CDFE|nr:histidine phosphatase family protein [Thalassobacillus sp. CUG 92003]
MDKLILVRHSAAEGQHEDSPLSKSGVRQSQALATFLDHSSYKIDRIISSPFLRATETIKPYAENKGIEIEPDARLEERILSREPLDDWEETLEDSFLDPEFKICGGESSNEAKQRVASLLQELENDADHDTTLLVTHGNLLALMLQLFNVEIGFKEWKQISNPDAYLVQKQGGDYIAERIWED